MCSLNESDTIETSLRSINEQSYSNNYEILLADSGSTDNTLHLAAPFCDQIVNVPRGKLTARNILTDYAHGDIIVSVDADTYYPSHWLNNLLLPFNDPDVVAVKGKTINGTDLAINGFWTWLDDIDSLVIHRNRMVGRNSAYYTDSFYDTGRFDDSINQQDATTIFNEEELEFGNRLAEYGKVVYVYDAECYHMHIGMDKVWCRLFTKIPGYKGECIDQFGVGTERF